MKFTKTSILILCASHLTCTKPKLSIMEKYNKAMEYYSKGDFSDATELFKEILPMLTGKVEGIEALYYLGQSYFARNDYAKALNVFSKFFDYYPQDERCEEVLYLQAVCAFNQSRNYKLDQKATYDALEIIDQYINLYSESGQYYEVLSQYKEQLHDKIENKIFYHAKIFFDLKHYEAAVIYCENMLRDNPNSANKIDIMVMLINSLYQIVSKLDVKEKISWSDDKKSYWLSFYKYYKIMEEQNSLNKISNEIKNFFSTNF